MKKLLSIHKCLSLFIVFVITSLCNQAQKNAAYEMLVDGVKIIVQPGNNDIVEIQTVIKGGVQNYPLEKQGIESIAFSALTECGTTADTKNSFKDKLDKVSAQVYSNAGMDFSTINMNCIRSDFNIVWPLYVAAITTPAFDEKEFIRLKQDAVNGLKLKASQPDFAIRKLARETAFKGKNYAKSPEGTEETVSKITALSAKEYYQSILTKSRLLIVIVGDIDKEELTKKLTGMLASIPAGKPFKLIKEFYSPAKNSFTSQKSELATNYIQGITGAPEPGTVNYNAFVLAMRIFAMRHFLEVRSKNGLSYAPGAYFDGGASPTANIVVSTTEPDKYIKVVQSLLQKIKSEGFTEQELKDMKTTYLTGFYYSQETNGAQAGSFVRNEVLHDNWKRALTFNDDLKKVSVSDLNNAFNKYVTNFTWSYRGNPAKVNAQLYTKPGQIKEVLPKSKVTVNKKE